MYERFAWRTLIVALAVVVTAPAGADAPRLLGAYAIQPDHPMLGGLSAVEITDDGEGFAALSDRGALIRGRLFRNDSGAVSGLALSSVEMLTARTGERGPRGARDSEGLAIAPDGRLFISYEGDHRVALHREGGDTILPGAEGFAALAPNASLEGLAVGSDGTLYAFPEDWQAGEGDFPVFRYRGGTWDTDLTVPRRGNYLLVGADFDDRGRLYLLERSFSFLFGFSDRIRRFSVGPEGLTDEETLLETGAGRFSNLEGLSIWRDGRGRLIASMVSDDNFSPLLPTQLVEFVLE